MIFYLRQSPDNAYQDFIRANPQFLSTQYTSFFPVRVDIEIDAQRNHRKLIGATNANLLVDFVTLLTGNDDDAIRGRTRQQLFDHQKQTRPGWSIVAVKNVPMIRVHHSKVTRFADKSRRRQPSIHQSRNSTDSSG